MVRVHRRWASGGTALVLATWLAGCGAAPTPPVPAASGGRHPAAARGTAPTVRHPAWATLLRAPVQSWPAVPAGLADTATLLAQLGANPSTPTGLLVGPTAANNPWVLATHLTAALAQPSAATVPASWQETALPASSVIVWQPLSGRGLTVRSAATLQAAWTAWHRLWARDAIGTLSHWTLVLGPSLMRFGVSGVPVAGRGTLTEGVPNGPSLGAPGTNVAWGTVRIAADGSGVNGAAGTVWTADIVMVRLSTGWHLGAWFWLRTPGLTGG
jgi:hypothetical protein